MSNLTLEDIASLAGVSRATVSRVVNDHPNVSDKVRKRVWEVVNSTGYTPNVAARALASQRSQMLGLVIPQSVSSFFTDPYFPHLIQGVALACNKYDYTLSLFLVDSVEDEGSMFSRISRRGMLDGIIVQAGHIGEKLIDRLVNSNIPVVIAGRPNHPDVISYIDIDNIHAAFKATDHLVNTGYRRIGTIVGTANTTVSLDRMAGYSKALNAQGRDVDASLVVHGDFSEASGYAAMQRLIPAEPDAIFAMSDQMAVGAMQAVRDAGLRIPEDIAFVGFDDFPFAAKALSPLTTIRQPVKEFGMQAGEILLDLINNGIEPARHIIMDTELIIRESCGASLKSKKAH